MEEYILNLTKDEFDSVKYALSIAQLSLGQKAINSAMFGNIKAYEAYKQQEQKMEQILKDLKNIEDVEEG